MKIIDSCCLVPHPMHPDSLVRRGWRVSHCSSPSSCGSLSCNPIRTEFLPTHNKTRVIIPNFWSFSIWNDHIIIRFIIIQFKTSARLSFYLSVTLCLSSFSWQPWVCAAIDMMIAWLQPKQRLELMQTVWVAVAMFITAALHCGIFPTRPGSPESEFINCGPERNKESEEQ